MLTRHLILDDDGILWIRDDVEELELVAGERLGPIETAFPPAGLWDEYVDLVDRWRSRIPLEELHAEASAIYFSDRGVR